MMRAPPICYQLPRDHRNRLLICANMPENPDNTAVNKWMQLGRKLGLSTLYMICIYEAPPSFYTK